MNQLNHSRIDAGQPKPKYPSTPSYSCVKRPLKAIPADRRAEIAQDVLARYLHGELVSEMALEYETSDTTIYALLLRDHEDQWKDIQIARAMARLERSQTGMDLAANPLELARAREQIKAAQWELERLLSRIYGVKQEITVKDHTPTINITILNSPPEQHVLEGQSTVIPEPSK